MKLRKLKNNAELNDFFVENGGRSEWSTVSLDCLPHDTVAFVHPELGAVLSPKGKINRDSGPALVYNQLSDILEQFQNDDFASWNTAFNEVVGQEDFAGFNLDESFAFLGLANLDTGNLEMINVIDKWIVKNRKKTFFYSSNVLVSITAVCSELFLKQTSGDWTWKARTVLDKLDGLEMILPYLERSDGSVVEVGSYFMGQLADPDYGNSSTVCATFFELNSKYLS